ncbi:hypothetical protein FA15DRAFT_703621 [Coprinopsis marcescibilis]|uniref:Mediator complex subunit 1 n=1 Tax=Coprinopsis marcescibilis TaxID=230819 RepID=A0A5C3KXZ0_COPMA|nr:hypothetical protein FA15DRAFT_703621 [Coprinopsis marcescibilis]
MQPSSSQTLDSSLKKFDEYNILPENVVHTFGSKAADSSALLKELLDATENISASLAAYSGTNLTKPKLVSLFRQISNTSQALYTSEKQSRHIISALRGRTNINYGESIPLIPAQVPDWCISRLEAWCNTAGLQAYKDDSRGKDPPTTILGGKVLVVDIDFVIERKNPNRPRIKVSRVKTNYAVPSDQLPSASLDEFLSRAIQAFCVEVQQSEDKQDPQAAARLGDNVLLQIQYLAMLDQLTQRQHDGGLKWYTALDEISPNLLGFASKEAGVVASSLSQLRAPLDIFLRRSHALPIPYLLAPSLSFLVYLSPLAYLSLLKSVPSNFSNTNTIPVDIPLPFLWSNLSGIPKGVTIATLILTQVSVPSLPSSMHVSTFATRPTFPLTPYASEHMFPQLADDLMLTDTVDPGQYEWVLDFTDSGKGPGVILSQSRMREIELVLNPLGGMGSLEPVNNVRPFHTLSWVDLLLNPEEGKSSEFYVATHISQSQAYPPLRLRLATSEEPGFWLQRIPVQSMKEVWGVLEIVREQCWLNETLSGYNWKAEESVAPDDVERDSDINLESILTGTNLPQHLPVNIYLPHHNVSTDAMFDPLSVSTAHRPKIVMTSPERTPISGLVEISVALDETKPRGIDIEIRGAVGMAIKTEELEEISRRGGTFGIPGTIWQRSHGSSH